MTSPPLLMYSFISRKSDVSLRDSLALISNGARVTLELQVSLPSTVFKSLSRRKRAEKMSVFFERSSLFRERNQEVGGSLSFFLGQQKVKKFDRKTTKVNLPREDR
jgi:hypothetical protein